MTWPRDFPPICISITWLPWPVVKRKKKLSAAIWLRWLGRGLLEFVMRICACFVKIQDRSPEQENPGCDLRQTASTETSILAPRLVCWSTDIGKWIKNWCFHSSVAGWVSSQKTFTIYVSTASQRRGFIKVKGQTKRQPNGQGLCPALFPICRHTRCFEWSLLSTYVSLPALLI